MSADSLGISSYYFLTRDCQLAADGIGDGYHTREELRQVIQNEVDEYERSGRDRFAWNRLEESRRMLEKMKEVGADAVDYLPTQFAGIDDRLRVRATELLSIAHEISDGRVDQSVLDYARRRCTTRADERKITPRQKEKILQEVLELASHLGLN